MPKSINTLTSRITVGGARVYITWSPPPDPYISLRLGKCALSHIAETGAALEIICVMAGHLLKCGAWTTERLIEEWRGVRLIPPCGVCPELDMMAASILAAVAVWIEKKERP